MTSTISIPADCVDLELLIEALERELDDAENAIIDAEQTGDLTETEFAELTAREEALGRLIDRLKESQQYLARVTKRRGA